MLSRLRRRADATAVTDAPLYRRFMPFLMRSRNESVVYFEQQLDLTRVLPYLQQQSERHGRRLGLFHLLTWGVVQTLHERPRLNRFVVGGRLWQRDGIWVSYSAKKKKDDASPIVVLKKRLDPAWSLAQLGAQLDEVTSSGRQTKKNRAEKEMDALLSLPGPLIRGFISAQKAADAAGVLPRWFLDSDPLYASMFIANLGSLKMDAAFHHLYEYGNIPIFCVIGRSQDSPVVEDGKVVAKPTVMLRWSFDERIEDGLYAQRSLEALRERLESPG